MDSVFSRILPVELPAAQEFVMARESACLKQGRVETANVRRCAGAAWPVWKACARSLKHVVMVFVIQGNVPPVQVTALYRTVLEMAYVT